MRVGLTRHHRAEFPARPPVSGPVPGASPDGTRVDFSAKSVRLRTEAPRGRDRAAPVPGMRPGF